MRLTSAGLLGLGTSSPTEKLSVVGNIRANGALVSTDGTNLAVLFADGTNPYLGTGGLATPFVFKVGNGSADVERMRLTSAGLLGLGTSSPLGTIHVKHATDANIFFRNGTAAGLSTGTIAECFNDATNATTPFYLRATSFQFGTDSGGTFVPRITATSGGLVGIGTSSPTAKLESYFSSTNPSLSSNTGAGLSVNGTSTVRLNFGNYPGSPFSSWVQSSDGVGTAYPIALNPLGGSVGVGTNSPSNTAGFIQQLEVAGSLPCISINQNNGSFTTRKYSLGVDSAGCFGIWDNTSNSYRFYINTLGNVGIGTTSPGVPLEVNGTIYSKISTSGDAAFGAVNSIASVFLLQQSDKAQIYTGAAQPIVFTNNNTERARIDSSGRLLVGTSTARSTGTVIWPSQIETATSFAGLGITTNSASTAGAYLSLAKSRGTTIGSNTIVANGDGLGYILFSGADGTDANTQAAYIGCEVDGTPGADDMPGRLVFSTTADGAASPTERMRITNGGLLNIGTVTAPSTVPGHDIRWQGANRCNFSNVDAAGANCYGILINYSNAAPNNTTNEFLYCQDNAGGGTARAVIRANGGLANFQANNVNLSDRNVKKDISPADGTWDCLKQWEIVNYRYKDQPDDVNLNLGVIAQQVAESCPEVITIFQESKEATEEKPAQEERFGVKEQQMYWMAIKALQEAQVRIEALEADVALLKGE
jgi:hypothetical protein